MRNTTEFYNAVSQALAWLESVNDDFRDQAEGKLAKLQAMLPQGSGFDIGSKVLRLSSTPQRIVIQADFHHMDEHGYYDGWSEHQVIITPCLQWGFKLRVTGRDRRGIKEYISDQFHDII